MSEQTTPYATTQACGGIEFGDIGTDGHHLFRVQPGVPAKDALEYIDLSLANLHGRLLAAIDGEPIEGDEAWLLMQNVRQMKSLLQALGAP